MVTVAVSGDYGKPRPAVVIQSDELAETDSILVCLITSELRDSPLHRLTLPTDETTGLRQASQIMVEKIFAVRRDKCGKVVGRMDEVTMLALGAMLAFVVGVGWGIDTSQRSLGTIRIRLYFRDPINARARRTTTGSTCGELFSSF